MKRLLITALLVASTGAFAGAKQTAVRTDVIRLVQCSVYHQAAYPLYTMAYLNSSALLYHQNDMGQINLETSTWKRIVDGAAKKFDGQTLDQKGASLIRCQEFLGHVVKDNDLVNYGKRVQAAAKK